MKLIISLSYFAMLLTLSSISNKNAFSSFYPQNLKTYPENLKIDSVSLILWQSNKKLTWDDFQGKPDSLRKYKAITKSKIKFKSENFDDSILLFIPCYFMKKESWSKNKKSKKLLTHEQLHFDIAELVTRKIRKECSIQFFTTIIESSSILEKIYDKNSDKIWDSINACYDKETKHGIIEKKQKEWEAKITKEIKALDKYASTKVVVKRK